MFCAGAAVKGSNGTEDGRVANGSKGMNGIP